MSSIHCALWDWLMDCPHIKDLFFNYARISGNDAAIDSVTTGGDTVIREFISGAAEHRYDFTVIRFDVLSDAPGSTENIEALIDAEQLREWIAAQDAAQNYPVFPEGCTVTKAAAYDDDVGAFAAQNENMAKYMFRFYIEYLKEA